ncbi:MAG: carboxypeptidase-like regulatory domain-containing protein [Bacteroidota bacterium]|nr:carboxypeptidase-like regulatory domain-containing protein [Bacteroidota bacterium]
MLRFFIIGLFAIHLLDSCNHVSKFYSSDTGHEIVKPEVQYLDSKVINLKTTGIADTTIAMLLGRIENTYIFKGKEFMEPIVAAMIMLRNKTNGKEANIFFKKNGSYKLYKSPGIYEITIKSVGCNTIDIKNISLGSGEIKQLDVQLALAGLIPKTKIFDVVANYNLLEKKN